MDRQIKDDVAELLRSQLLKVEKAIQDLLRVREDLPVNRRAEIDAVIDRLQDALADDHAALKRIGRGLSPSSDV